MNKKIVKPVFSDLPSLTGIDFPDLPSLTGTDFPELPCLTEIDFPDLTYQREKVWKYGQSRLVFPLSTVS